MVPFGLTENQVNDSVCTNMYLYSRLRVYVCLSFMSATLVLSFIDNLIRLMTGAMLFK